MKNTWALYIVGYSDDQDRTEYVADEYHGFKTREEAVARKRECFGENGIWTGCDVYAKICEE